MDFLHLLLSKPHPQPRFRPNVIVVTQRPRRGGASAVNDDAPVWFAVWVVAAVAPPRIALRVALRVAPLWSLLPSAPSDRWRGWMGWVGVAGVGRAYEDIHIDRSVICVKSHTFPFTMITTSNVTVTVTVTVTATTTTEGLIAS